MHQAFLCSSSDKAQWEVYWLDYGDQTWLDKSLVQPMANRYHHKRLGFLTHFHILGKYETYDYMIVYCFR